MSDEAGEFIPKVQIPRGVHDILPDEQRYHTLLKKVVRNRARQASFLRISLPAFEETELFNRAVGSSTDVVEKELFSFPSRSGIKHYSLRPEFTAGIVRSYIQHGMSSLPQPVMLYTFDPVFRYDRPQKGRYRQFYQMGFEVIGDDDPSLDAQLMHISYQILKDLKISHRFTLQLNTLGDLPSRKAYIEDLIHFYHGKERSLCENCVSRLASNPLRLFDCKKEDCRILSTLAPKIETYLNEKSKKHYEDVKKYLTELEIPFVENPQLVRGLDYYTHTVFEFWDASAGAQNAVGGGGRYDGLVEALGGAPTPGLGMAFGVERLILHMKDEGLELPNKDQVQVYVSQLGEEAKRKSLKLIESLHNAGIHAVGGVGKASMTYQLKLANKSKAPWALILGEVEVREGNVLLRNMQRGSQETVPYDKVVEIITEKIGKENLDIVDFWS